MHGNPRASGRKLGYRVAAGVLDFFGVIGCTVLIIALLAVMINLYGWLREDLSQTFAGLSQNVTDAMIID